jgi:hypothetical protein
MRMANHPAGSSSPTMRPAGHSPARADGPRRGSTPRGARTIPTNRGAAMSKKQNRKVVIFNLTMPKTEIPFTKLATPRSRSSASCARTSSPSACGSRSSTSRSSEQAPAVMVGASSFVEVDTAPDAEPFPSFPRDLEALGAHVAGRRRCGSPGRARMTPGRSRTTARGRRLGTRPARPTGHPRPRPAMTRSTTHASNSRIMNHATASC